MNDAEKKDLRRSMRRNRIFLHQLSSESVRQTTQRLNTATEVQLNVLLRILHAIINGNIPITAENQRKIANARKFNHLDLIGDDLESYLSKPKTEKLSYLKKLKSLYPSLLFLLFNKKK